MSVLNKNFCPAIFIVIVPIEAFEGDAFGLLGVWRAYILDVHARTETSAILELANCILCQRCRIREIFFAEFG